MAAVVFQGPPFLKGGGTLDPHFIILEPTQPLWTYFITDTHEPWKTQETVVSQQNILSVSSSH